MNRNRRIGVYVCHCGTNISQHVDVEAVVEHAATLPGVAVAKEYKYMCSAPGQQLIRADILEQELTHVVVAACSPLMHEATFRRLCDQAGLNAFLFQMANIREHCSWVHKDRGRATGKAKRLVAAAVRRVTFHDPLREREVPVGSEALVIGGGIAGIEAALRISDSGRKVYLVEKQSSIGGHMARFDKTFPTLDCAACILTPKMMQVGQHPNIELLTLAEVEEVSGFVGNFTVRIRQHARYVTDACTGCGECTEVCPCVYPDAFEMGMATRKAIHRSFPQAVPNWYVIEKRGVPMCEATCPLHTRTQGYVNLIARGDFAGALKVIRDVNPLPATLGRVCHHPCEDHCQRGAHDEPVAVCALKRFVADWEFQQGLIPPVRRAESNGRKVAVIGSGPAGMTAAYDLARKGYRVTVLEKYAKPGGLMRTGIPAFRLPTDVLERELNWILDHGVELRLNTALGDGELTVDSLLASGYEALILALGTTKGRDLGIPGEHLPGVINCLPYLRAANLDGTVPTGRVVAVVGGGNAAVDSARTALRHGAQKVIILYRRTRAEMPAIGAEIDAAERENIEFHFLINPVEMKPDGAGHLAAVRCQQMRLGEPDASGRRRPIPIEDAFIEIAADQVILAISQLPDLDFLVQDDDFDLTSWATLQADPDTCETRKQGVFACGDAVRGPSTVVEAMASGRRAATAVDLFLQGQELSILRRKDHRPQQLPTLDHVRRPERPLQARTPIHLDPDAGVTLREVERAFTEEEAVREAGRCLVCGVCSDCRLCSQVCGAGAIDHAQQDSIRELKVGTIIVATGFQLFDCRQIERYGYGRYPNVINALEFERLSHASGPTGGRILTAEGKPPKAVAIIHCVGSRDENFHAYCSRVCCMISLKFAHLVREKTGARVYNLYIDIRAPGKGYEEFYKRILSEDVQFIRGKCAEITDVAESPAEQNRLVVITEDTLLGVTRRLPVDLVILSPALEPAEGADELANRLSLSCSQGDFFLEKHPKLAPVEAATDGLFLAGACQGPKDIPDSVAQGAAAAACALSLMDRGKVVLEPITAEIDADLCSGCRLCLASCPYEAIIFDEKKHVSVVQEELCKGCGTCVSTCPSGVPKQKGFTDVQVDAEMEGLLV